MAAVCLTPMPLQRLTWGLLVAALTGCAAVPHGNIATGMSERDVTARLGKPVATGRLPTGDEYRDYSRQPFGYTIERVIYSADGRVQNVRNLLTEDNFQNIKNGMRPEDVVTIVGPPAPSRQRTYAGGTKSWVYRYYDYGVIKLLNVIFDANDRVISHYTEWDPSVYSKGDGSRSSHGK